MTDSLDLQRSADELASRLSGDDRMLVYELRSHVERLTELKAKIATLAK